VREVEERPGQGEEGIERTDKGGEEIKEAERRKRRVAGKGC
jgi:hypothetical protein